jgi:putative hydrolase of HD superfamily
MDPGRVLECLAELHYLTRLPRTGWVLAGVARPESIADHCFETAIIASVLASHPGQDADLGRVLAMALFHDAAEVRLGDRPRRSAPYTGDLAGAEEECSRDLLDGMPGDIPGLPGEFAGARTPEARIVRAAHELQISAAALYYAREQQGDLAEYVRDAERYDPLGIEPAAALARAVRARLAGYAGDRPYWALGYRRRMPAGRSEGRA